jgi:hypothetical protein
MDRECEEQWLRSESGWRRRLWVVLMERSDMGLVERAERATLGQEGKEKSGKGLEWRALEMIKWEIEGFQQTRRLEYKCTIDTMTGPLRKELYDGERGDIPSAGNWPEGGGRELIGDRGWTERVWMKGRGR